MCGTLRVMTKAAIDRIRESLPVELVDAFWKAVLDGNVAELRGCGW